jgi:hypothetical protein
VPAHRADAERIIGTQAESRQPTRALRNRGNSWRRRTLRGGYCPTGAADRTLSRNRVRRPRDLRLRRRSWVFRERPRGIFCSIRSTGCRASRSSRRNPGLIALLARSAFVGSGLHVQLRSCSDLAQAVLDWRSVERGGSDLVYCYPPGRKLEDRVLDVVRIVEAACSMESVDCEKIEFHSAVASLPDEFAIVQFFRSRGWIRPGETQA